jgi:hypothetical protein
MQLQGVMVLAWWTWQIPRHLDNGRSGNNWERENVTNPLADMKEFNNSIFGPMTGIW